MVGLLVVAVIGLGSLAAYVKYGGASQVPDGERRPDKVVHAPATHNDTKPESKVTVIKPTREGDDLKLHKSETDVPKGEDPIVFSVNHYLKESQIVPADAKIVGVQVKDRVALLDVSPSFNQTYGAFDEQTLLQGICATLAQFKNIDKVQFLLEGKPIETLGNVDLTTPIPVRTGSTESPTTPPAN